AERVDPATDHEARDAGSDYRLRLMAVKLGAPVGQPHDFASQSLERDAQLLAVLLDRGTDLVRRARRHQLPPSGFAVTVSRIFFASSIAIDGVGAPTRSLRHANRNAPSDRKVRTPSTIANP